MEAAYRILEPGPYCPDTGQAQITSNCWRVSFAVLKGKEELAEALV